MKTKPKYMREPARLVDGNGRVYYVGTKELERRLGVSDTSISRVLREWPCPSRSLLIRIYNAFPDLLDRRQKAFARELIKGGFVVKAVAKKGAAV